MVLLRFEHIPFAWESVYDNTKAFPDVYQYVTDLTVYIRGSQIDDLLETHFSRQEPSINKIKYFASFHGFLFMDIQRQ